MAPDPVAGPSLGRALPFPGRYCRYSRARTITRRPGTILPRCRAWPRRLDRCCPPGNATVPVTQNRCCSGRQNAHRRGAQRGTRPGTARPSVPTGSVWLETVAEPYISRRSRHPGRCTGYSRDRRRQVALCGPGCTGWGDFRRRMGSASTLPVPPCGGHGRPAPPQCSRNGSIPRSPWSSTAPGPPCWIGRARVPARTPGSSWTTCSLVPFFICPGLPLPGSLVDCSILACSQALASSASTSKAETSVRKARSKARRFAASRYTPAGLPPAHPGRTARHLGLVPHGP